jgi:hypothetical protein
MQITINHKEQSITVDWKIYYYTYFSRLDRTLKIGLYDKEEITLNTTWAIYNVIWVKW